MKPSIMAKLQILFAMAVLCCSLFIPSILHAMYDPTVLMLVSTKGKQPEPGKPFTLNITVKSKIALKEPKVTLTVKKKNGQLVERAEVWAGSQDDTYPCEFEQVVQALLPGRYLFEVQLIFTAPDEGRIPMMVGGVTPLSRNREAKETTYSLNRNFVLDVRPHRIYGGPSFETIEKRELIQEIRLKSGKGKDFSEEEIRDLPISELEKIHGGPWKDKLDESGESEQ